MGKDMMNTQKERKCLYHSYFEKGLRNKIFENTKLEGSILLSFEYFKG